MNALRSTYLFIVNIVTAVWNAVATIWKAATSYFSTRRFYTQCAVAGLIFSLTLGAWATTLLELSLIDPGLAKISRSDFFYTKFGLVIGRTVVLDPDTEKPILVVFDKYGEEVKEIGPQVNPYDTMTIWSAAAYREEVTKYRTFIQEEADGLARGHCLVSIENYGSEHCGSATVTVAASTPGGQSEQVTIEYPGHVNNIPNIKYVVLRNSSTVIDPRLLGEDGPVLLTSPINLNSIDELVVNDTNVRSLLLTENGEVHPDTATKHNIGYRTGYFEPTKEYDEEEASENFPEDREDRALGPIAGAKVSSGYDPNERYAVTTEKDGFFRVEYFLPPCPCFSFSYDGDLWAEIPYKNYNPLNSDTLPFASFFTSTPNYDFCSGYHYCPFLLTSLTGQLTLINVIGIHAASATPNLRNDILFDAMILTGEGQITDENGDALPIEDTAYATEQQGNFDDEDPASLAFDFDLDRQMDNAVLHNGEYYVYLGGREVERDAETNPIDEDLRRRPDQINDYEDRGLLRSISIEDLKETDLYIYRVSTGELIVERENLKPEEYARLSFGDVSKKDNQFFYTQMMRGPRVFEGSLGNRLSEWWSNADIKIELFDKFEADFLRMGEEVQIIAINRPTGYIGSTIAKLQFNTTETGSNTLDVPIDKLKLRPPNLKIRAERRTKTELGLTRGEINDYLISSEGAGLTSDEYIAIKTEWFDHDGSALPSDLPGYSGTLAKIVGNQMLGSDSACTSSVSPISIKPGSRIQLLKLGDNCDLGKEHYYVYICGHNKADSARDKCFSFGNTNDIGRPKYYVPVKVPLYDEIASRQQYNAYRYGQQDGIIGEGAEVPEPIYRWHYRPEMQFSVYELKQMQLEYENTEQLFSNVIDLTKKRVSEEVNLFDSSIDFVKLLYEIINPTHEPLTPFGAERELVLAIGAEEVRVTLGTNGIAQFDYLDHLALLGAEDFLAIRLYQNNDSANILWQQDLSGLEIITSDNQYSNAVNSFIITKKSNIRQSDGTTLKFPQDPFELYLLNPIDTGDQYRWEITIPDRDKYGTFAFTSAAPIGTNTNGAGTYTWNSGWLTDPQYRTLKFKPEELEPRHLTENYCNKISTACSELGGTRGIDEKQKNPQYKYNVKVTVNSITSGWRVYTGQIQMDQIDAVRQEYINHGINYARVPVPNRYEFNEVEATDHFSATELNNTLYSLVPGNPGVLAEAIRDEYNSRIYDDVQTVAVGTSGLQADTVVISPGQDVIEVGAILDTPACNGATSDDCDDLVSGTTIVAGPNGIAETAALNRVTNYGLIVSSPWRNPERNEIVGGVINSKHQLGSAIDLVVGTVPGKTRAQLFCILETAADNVPGHEAIAEHNSTQVTCNNVGTSTRVTHIHTQAE